jgi:hypothetical protein
VIEFLSRFVNQFKLYTTDSLVTDCGFPVKAFKVLRAQALLNGSMQAIPADLVVLSYVTTFRIPDELNRNLPQVLAEVIQLVNEQEFTRWAPP